MCGRFSFIGSETRGQDTFNVVFINCCNLIKLGVIIISSINNNFKVAQVTSQLPQFS